MDGRLDEARRTLDGVPINTMFAVAALDAGAPLWSDREVDPRAFHVVHPYGMSFVWGPALDEAVGVVAEHLVSRTTGEEWLQVEPRWNGLDWDGALAAAHPTGARVAVTRHARLNFAFDADAFAARRGALAPTDGWAARRAVADDFGWAGSVVPSLFWADAGTFLSQGGGVVVERDGETGAMAFTSYRRGDRLELGIETAHAWRRRGLASAAAAAMIDVALDAGLEPVWSCRDGNVGSHRLACALGFTLTTRTPYFHLAAAPS
ncbi:GNAT family N-acetyltransferase [Cellulomonas fimi]|uniref:GCN5-related N-acetyltransferase n=1 Tax=Cellulomonas fimi (strain ATCC 484 / DSM 20113 / JCM 1341 / CCUG 24087 / LMG 16345 / NBRC 15513 / NCIMB 8980 / NCTC 7547 / NRS-133) TaxID=590998 RepID=F4H5X7_CELFA|nr:GNAT family N-acetyltransferase [Cellulomonas fimi]AEE46707.1 GCN5-related N-acetyltransferase [Cellulomonas fimi ATCC 484]NNH07648.1 GNAT family N-acetyltransferase [Cellulomonas fimi]VEH33942.1 GNAT acetyltransferase [Cellulomonas fimi]